MTLDPIVNLNLEDAIAYDFYMSHVESVLEESEDQVNDLALLAQCGYHLADIFCAVKEKHEPLIKPEHMQWIETTKETKEVDE